MISLTQSAADAQITWTSVNFEELNNSKKELKITQYQIRKERFYEIDCEECKSDHNFHDLKSN